MSTRYVALLRGINVGRAKRIAMSDLRSLCEALGYGRVSTLLNSGNIVFEAKGKAAPDSARKHAAKIEATLTERTGVRARVIVVSADEVASIVEENPLLGVAENPSRLFAAVFASLDDRARFEPLVGQIWAPEAFALGSRAAYLWCPAGPIDSKLNRAMSRLLADGVTSRNWSTMLKLRALAGP